MWSANPKDSSAWPDIVHQQRALSLYWVLHQQLKDYIALVQHWYEAKSALWALEWGYQSTQTILTMGWGRIVPALESYNST